MKSKVLILALLAALVIIAAACAQPAAAPAPQAAAPTAAAPAAQPAAPTAAAPAAAASAGTGGQGGNSQELTAKYAAAIQQAVLGQWIRPDTVPLGQRCRVSIRQIPGGEVIDVEVQPGCPFDEAGRRSLEAAVLRAKPLPYRGFESVFQRNLTLNFEAQDR